ncbi:hypothetical protein Pyn_25713 [Prunus yedoensis var. nudiflora]|uniref:Uncharacterized protein n=1 Tax=Prunus yedoensis var. nudiflora TaxID=2094558 RepID=A0A314XRB9_PRUYE|nr:hypothetical protein Pyn_25713 [Prunus yedoensis var. nudiflora]
MSLNLLQLVVDKEEKMHSDSCPLLPEQSNNFVANPTKKPSFQKKEALVECLKEKKLFKDTAAKLKADHEKAFESDNGEVGDRVT